MRPTLFDYAVVPAAMAAGALFINAAATIQPTEVSYTISDTASFDKNMFPSMALMVVVGGYCFARKSGALFFSAGDALVTGMTTAIVWGKKDTSLGVTSALGAILAADSAHRAYSGQSFLEQLAEGGWLDGLGRFR